MACASQQVCPPAECRTIRDSYTIFIYARLLLATISKLVLHTEHEDHRR